MAKLQRIFFWPSIIIIAIFLRIYPSLDEILFTYDQARDALIALEIVSGNLKITGPSVSEVPGLFHGPLYFYFLSGLYGIYNDPRFAVLGIIGTNLLSLIPLYLLTRKMFTSDLWAKVAVVLFAVSFEAVEYARWLSNPTLVVPAFILYLYGLWDIKPTDRKSWILIAIGLGVSIQAQLFMAYLIPVTLLYFLIFKVNIFHKNFVLAISVLGIFLSTFLLAELKFGFLGSKNLLQMFIDHNVAEINLQQRFLNYSNSLYKVFSGNL